MKKIRQISDPILHQIPKLVDFKNLQWDLTAIYQIMLNQQIQNGGVGIAANQCSEIENPPQMVLIGFPKGHEDAKKTAQARYPGQTIPDTFVMINPKILYQSSETYYPVKGEGCISVAGALRGKVERSQEVTVNYFDENGQSHTETFSGFTAHIVQHEVDHLLGIVYLQKILSELSKDQLEELLEILVNPPQITSSENVENLPMLVFDRTEEGMVVINTQVILASLSQLDTSTLEGIIEAINQKLEKIQKFSVGMS